MTYTANEPNPTAVYRDGDAIAFTRGDDFEAPKEARLIAAALNNAEQGPLSSYDYQLLADALDVLDPDGSEQTARKQELEAWARSMAATGRGYLPPAEPGRTAPHLSGGDSARPGLLLTFAETDAALKAGELQTVRSILQGAKWASEWSVERLEGLASEAEAA